MEGKVDHRVLSPHEVYLVSVLEHVSVHRTVILNQKVYDSVQQCHLLIVLVVLIFLLK